MTRAGGRQPDAASRPDSGANRPGTRRVFVAVPLPEAARADVTALVDSVRATADPGARDVRWVRLDGLHVTLRFVGPVDEGDLKRLAGAVDAAAASVTGFRVSVESAGAFPAQGRPRVIWLGIGEGGRELGEVASAVDDALADVGIARSERPFRAHLTVARADGIRTGADVARRLIAAAADWRTAFVADRIVLFESISGGGPARYEPLHAVPIGNGIASSSVSGPRRPAVAPVLPSEPSAGDGTSVGARRKEQSSGT
ncbi:MAG TPA: RNA 2',3'-cyclic phosphodiesterase [Candidatus Limnocylindrales bacterium]|nr:RNA 2',3'-cyclic phosphodiesterase [Candidatus Limnocylindrales bacterium]